MPCTLTAHFPDPASPDICPVLGPPLPLPAGLYTFRNVLLGHGGPLGGGAQVGPESPVTALNRQQSVHIWAGSVLGPRASPEIEAPRRILLACTLASLLGQMLARQCNFLPLYLRGEYAPLCRMRLEMRQVPSLHITCSCDSASPYIPFSRFLAPFTCAAPA